MKENEEEKRKENEDRLAYPVWNMHSAFSDDGIKKNCQNAKAEQNYERETNIQRHV